MQPTIEKCYMDDGVLKELLRKCISLNQLEMVRQMNKDRRCFMHEFPQIEGTLRSNANFDPICLNVFIRKNTHQNLFSLKIHLDIF